MSGGDPKRVTLVIGGTGMLAGATRWLMRRSEQMLLVARRADRFAPDEPAVTPVVCDWNSKGFRSALTDALQKAAQPVDLALLWLHDPDPILAWLGPLIQNARVVIVLGSMDGNPQAPAFANLVTIRLGSIATPHGRRWLTHEEISDAAIQSMTDGRSQIVGELAPL